MKTGLALRATVFEPRLMAELVPRLDRSRVDSVWFPSVGSAFDPLDMSGISLGKTGRLRVGTGVIRSTDYDAPRLLARLRTLSEASGGRFVLGVGTGGGTGRDAVRGLVSLTEKLRTEYPGRETPPIYFAALRRGILREACRHADGAILNFCPPGFVQEIVPEDIRPGTFTLGCYIKLFFAGEATAARRMLVDEMKMYNAIPQYHAMFEEVGVASLMGGLGAGSSIPERLLEISLANPDDDQVAEMVKRFSRAGVDLPILYPYVSGGESYKTSIIDRLCALA